MTFPVTVGPGQTGFLANPDQQTYFFWQGKRTSAQYYVNKQGVPEDEACTWGTEMGGKGNWAPAVFGTSFDDGPVQQGFSSLKQNELCKQERLGYDITFVGDGVVSACRYKSATNQWCEGDQCWEDPDRGCTVGHTLIILNMKLILCPRPLSRTETLPWYFRKDSDTQCHFVYRPRLLAIISSSTHSRECHIFL